MPGAEGLVCRVANASETVDCEKVRHLVARWTSAVRNEEFSRRIQSGLEVR